MASSTDRKFIGFDLSTQSLKAVVINENLNVLFETFVQFDSELPEFRTHGGVHVKEETSVATSPTLMWVKSLDLVLEKLRVSGLDFSTVAGLSGDGQQHGSVYWKKGAIDILKNLKPEKFLHEQIQSNCLSVRDSPVWMDSSTTVQCRQIEETIGGALKLAQLTGSRAYERFTASQIKKLHDTRPDVYHNTERISLVSSFLASVFLGDFASIDYSDASGMNLMDIWEKDWSDICLEACAPGLRGKLGPVVPTQRKLGNIAPYFVERYGFSPDCNIIGFTGDNSASLAGLRLKTGDFVVSLGTSDTVFVVLNEPKPALEGHVMCNPTNTKSYFVMLCYKNGSLPRERIRDECAEGSWNLFKELLESTPRGNFGNIGMYFNDSQEIIPFVTGDHRFNKINERVTRFSKEVEVRALIEGQFLAKRLHAEKLGFRIEKESRILATGGAAHNAAILQVLADVFNAPVYSLDVQNSASLGSAYLAKFGSAGEPDVDFHQLIKDGPQPKLAASPHADAVQVYSPMVTRYQKLEDVIVSNQQGKTRF